MTEIRGFFGPYRFLSNFTITDNIEYDGHVYRSTEHAYQAAKTLNEGERQTIREADTCRLARKLGQTVEYREDWENIKLAVMMEVNIQKYCKPNWTGAFLLKDQLLATGEAYLEETNTWGDVFWGVCNGVGENHLGRILMDIRKYLRELS